MDFAIFMQIFSYYAEYGTYFATSMQEDGQQINQGFIASNKELPGLLNLVPSADGIKNGSNPHEVVD